MVAAETLEPSGFSQKVQDWKPQGSMTWVLAFICIFLFANIIWQAGAHAWSYATTDNSPLVEILESRPQHVYSYQGDPIAIEYLYTKRACYGQVSYTMREVADAAESVNNWTMGPYAAAWPATEEPRWIKQTIPERYSNLAPGEYKLFWQASTTCENGEGEKPTSKTIYTKSPTTYITIVEPGLQLPEAASRHLPTPKDQ